MAPPAHAPVVEARGITFGYGREAVLEGVDLTIHRDDFLAVLGPNGGGKTTLVKVLLGLLTPWSGTVRRHTSERGGALGYVPQFAEFDRRFPMRVKELVLLGRLGLRGPGRRYGREDREAVARVLSDMGLAGQAEAPLDRLSGGQLQRALIARALVSEPEVLFLDEPLASIDAESREVLLATLRRLGERIPVVVVTHDLTPFAGTVRQIACINRRLHYHPSGELTPQMLEEVYGCPVELVAHGVPHRVLAHHHGEEG
ncbi:MAG TPA: metal ABC transporter ATP-binding protein [Thermoanaerobaculia bacterium]|nr:metal ABC transporter ATP-binding protein [Thermoanaerobaculia bacterium]